MNAVTWLGCKVETERVGDAEHITLSVPLTLSRIEQQGKVWIMTSNHPVRDTWVWKYFNGRGQREA